MIVGFLFAEVGVFIFCSEIVKFELKLKFKLVESWVAVRLWRFLAVFAFWAAAVVPLLPFVGAWFGLIGFDRLDLSINSLELNSGTSWDGLLLWAIWILFFWVCWSNVRSRSTTLALSSINSTSSLLTFSSDLYLLIIVCSLICNSFMFSFSYSYSWISLASCFSYSSSSAFLRFSFSWSNLNFSFSSIRILVSCSLKPSSSLCLKSATYSFWVFSLSLFLASGLASFSGMS